MPWKEQKPMDQKVCMVSDRVERNYNISELSRKYRISRKTVYKWVDRYGKEGLDGLKEMKREHRWHPHTTDKQLVRSIIEKKCSRRSWGPKKIIASLKKECPDKKWPAASTAGEWLKKEGLVKERKKRQSVPAYCEPFKECEEPNDVWSADYKGQIRTRDHKKCYPLTISDNRSRYLLACAGLEGTRLKETTEIFKKVFKKYGLPHAIRVDNGTPFAGKSAGGLSNLTLWWIKLGITPERIEKGKPYQNGRHERMHRTLKAETMLDPASNMAKQQKRFDWFKKMYNEERPHEALGQMPPVMVYQKSNRQYRDTFYDPEYELDREVRSVKRGGEIKFRNRMYFLSKVLAGERVGLKEIDNGIWQINYSFYPLGTLNLRRMKIKRG